MVSNHFFQKNEQKCKKWFRYNKCPMYMTTNDNDKLVKTSKLFYCEICDYSTSRNYNLQLHFNSIKHKNNENTTGLVKISKLYKCENCNKSHKDRAGLWRHKQKCIIIDVPSCNKECIIEAIPSDKELIMDVLQQNKELNKILIEQSKQNAELHEKIIELCKNGVVNNSINNSHNKSFNLNFFLNETCKDAMNLTDFAKTIVLQLSDIDAIGEVGYVNRITSIIASHLNSLAENRRPIHCTDVKREVMYVKDEDKWERDENRKKLRLLIRKMDRMLGPLMATYGANFMKGYHSDMEYIKYNDIVKEVYGGKNEESVNEDTIIRNISKIEGLRPCKG